MSRGWLHGGPLGRDVISLRGGKWLGWDRAAEMERHTRMCGRGLKEGLRGFAAKEGEVRQGPVWEMMEPFTSVGSE